MAEVFDVTAEEWEGKVLNSDKPVVVDFWHQHCTWCRRLDPIYKEVAGEFEVFDFTRLNVLENREVGERYGIMSTPTLKLFCEGRPMGELVGYREKPQLREEIENWVDTHRDCVEQSTPAEG